MGKPVVILGRVGRGENTELTASVFDAAGLGACIEEDDLVALKMHFGEGDKPQVVPPPLVKTVIEKVSDLGGRPFVTDSNTIYRGRRSNAVEHLQLAYEHGYTPEYLGAPLVIGDGLRGNSFVEAPVPGGKRCRTAKIGAEIFSADAVIALTHVTGHGMFGLAASIKNLGMGSGSRGGKQMMHSDVKPDPDHAECVACRVCARHCPVDAIEYSGPDGKAVIDHSKCIGCGECVAMCPAQAIGIHWGEAVGCQERTAEFCAALMNGRTEKFGFTSFLLAVSPGCDCMSRPGKPFVPDIGIIASRDPVAVDLATARIVNETPPLPGSEVENVKPPDDKFRGLFPDVDWEIQTRRMAELGMGSYEYQLKEV